MWYFVQSDFGNWNKPIWNQVNQEDKKKHLYYLEARIHVKAAMFTF